jgi:hypothetical protein
MKVLKVTDQEDGSAILDLELSEQESNFFLEYAIVDILKKQINRMGEGSSEQGSEEI